MGSAGISACRVRVPLTALNALSANMVTGTGVGTTFPFASGLAGKNALPFVGTGKEALVWPVGMVTAAGLGMNAGIALENVTSTPPATAGAWSVTVPVAVSPIVMVEGVNDKPATIAPGFGVRIIPIVFCGEGVPLKSTCAYPLTLPSASAPVIVRCVYSAGSIWLRSTGMSPALSQSRP